MERNKRALQFVLDEDVGLLAPSMIVKCISTLLTLLLLGSVVTFRSSLSVTSITSNKGIHLVTTRTPTSLIGPLGRQIPKNFPTTKSLTATATVK